MSGKRPEWKGREGQIEKASERVGGMKERESPPQKKGWEGLKGERWWRIRVWIDWGTGWGEKDRLGEERASRSTVLEG